MTNEETATSRAWFFPTSPRSPYKIRPELQMLSQISHLPWSREKGQAEFAKLLAKASTFEGVISSEEPTFSARDRTRAPKILGLVEQVGRGNDATISLTPAGEELLKLNEHEETWFFLNQVSKVQFPSAQHGNRGFSQMDCRPLTITLEIMLEIGPVTKEEFGLFILTCISQNQVKEAISGISNFRKAIRTEEPGLPRKQIKETLINQRVYEVYRQDIERGTTLLREGGRDFIATKRRTLVQDYADSSFRYLLATGLFRIEPHGRTFSIIDSKRVLAESLVADLGLGSSFPDYNPRTYTNQYLGNTREPRLSAFNLQDQARRMRALLFDQGIRGDQAESEVEVLSREPRGYKRAILVDSLEAEKREESLNLQSAQLVENRSTLTLEILDTFDEIVSRESGILDKPLFLEWNTWRAFTALNDAVSVVGNFRCDTEGNPLGTASGKQPDIVAEYRSFWLAIEVTLQSGHKQYETESESITRHVGELQAKLRGIGDERPVYGVFIAPKINETVLNYLMTQANMKSNIYKGSVKIAPLNLVDFQHFVSRHTQVLEPSSDKLRNAFDAVFESDLVASGDEPRWFEVVSKTFRELKLA